MYKVGDKVILGLQKKTLWWSRAYTEAEKSGIILDSFRKFKILGKDRKNYLVSMEEHPGIESWKVRKEDVKLYEGLSEKDIGHKVYMVVEAAIKGKVCQICERR